MTMLIPRFLLGIISLLLGVSCLALEEGACSEIDDSCQADDYVECEDEKEECSKWAKEGECIANPGYMTFACRRSCELCADQIRFDPVVRFQELGEGSELGVAQKLEDASHSVDAASVVKRLESSLDYLKETEKVDKKLKDICRNEHKMCTIWALRGECVKNSKYMKKSCAPACQSCDYLSIMNRCPIDPNAPKAWDSGDLDKMFSKLSNEPFKTEYDVKVLSSPPTGPWVITMENVVREEEAKRLIDLGRDEGYKRSSDVGKVRPDGTVESNINSGRTSTNAWCQHGCYKDEHAQRVIQRLSNITGIDEPNSEYLQLLRYEVGQHYQTHHDYVPLHTERQIGVRLLTVYLYLNDVEAGGGTNFDQLNITVMPKRGRALLWPSVLNLHPNQKDGRTTHQALPVEKGIKYGANAWFHMHDFKTPLENGCG